MSSWIDGTSANRRICQPAFSSVSSSDLAAWPRTRNRHILQLGTGAFPGSPDSDALAVKALAEAPYKLSLSHTAADYIPNFIEPFNDVEAVSVPRVLYPLDLFGEREDRG